MIKIKRFFENLYDFIVIKYKRIIEIKKFKNPERKSIYKKVALSKKQKQEIDALYSKSYGKKVPHIWHRHYSAFTGEFDVKYFPELLYIPEFEHFMNLDKEYCKVFSDKNVLPDLAKSVGVKTAKVFLECIKGNYRKEKKCIAKDIAIKSVFDIGEVFLKPTVDSCSGQGCMVANFVKGIDTFTNKSVYDVLNMLGQDFVVQERITCHSEISSLYSGCVNTFRIMTYRWKDDLLIAPVIMRIGQGGSHLDNAHAGGMFIAVDDDGTLHKTAFTEFKKEFTMHPDSKLAFEGHKISLFPKVISAAKRMHDAIPQIGVVNWDFTIDVEETPVLIEANLSGGSVWLFQMAHGKGVFGEKTADILKWLSLMTKTPKTKRSQYRFGKA